MSIIEILMKSRKDNLIDQIKRETSLEKLVFISHFMNENNYKRWYNETNRKQSNSVY